MSDPVHHPAHYASGHPVFPGECIDYSRHMAFDIGNAFKYLWRWDKKENPIQDLNKALWYLDDAIANGLLAATLRRSQIADLRNGVGTYAATEGHDPRVLEVASIQYSAAVGDLVSARTRLVGFIAEYERANG